MKTKYKAIRLLFPVLLFPLCLGAQENANIDSASILKTLKAIKQKHLDIQKQSRQKAFQEVTAAAASTTAAVNFYEEAVRAVRFDGQSRETTQFNEWKRKGKEAERMKDKNWQEATRMHLAWLALTLQHASGIEAKDLLPQLLGYAKQLIAERDQLAAQAEMLNRPVSDSVFIQWLQIGGQLTNLEKWEMTPGNLDGIYQKILLPELRILKDPQILEYWNLRILREGNAAAATQRTFDLDKFTEITRSNLLWNRARELIVLGKKSKALAEMLGIIKNHPTHPNVEGWIAEMEALLADPAAQATPEPAAEIKKETVPPVGGPISQ